MNKSMTECKRSLTTLWFSGSGILFFLIILQSILGKFGQKSSEVWSWFLPTITPTLSLVLSVHVMDAIGKGVKIEKADGFLFKLTYRISLAYLLAVLLIFFLHPFSSIPIFDLMILSNLWLGPFQGLVAAAMGAFFMKAHEEQKVTTRNSDTPDYANPGQNPGTSVNSSHVAPVE